MKKNLLLFILLFFLSFTVFPQVSDWNQLEIYGGDVRVLYTDGNNIYTGTANGGLYYSSDNGSTWNYFDFNFTTVRAIVVLPSGLLLAGTDKGLYYKPVSGGSGGLVLQNNPVTALVRNSNGDIYAGTSSGVYKSTDGINWSSSGISSSTIRCLSVISGNIYAGTSGQGIFRSTNNGSTWNAFGLGISYVRSIASHPNGNIFAGTWGGVQRYNGSQWIAAGLQSLDVPDISIDNNGNIYAATWEGVFKSTNLGSDWELLGFQESITWSLKVFYNFILTGRDGDGIYKSADDGVTWTSSSIGLKAARIWKMELKDNLLFAGASGGAYRSTNMGDTWTKVLNYNHANRFWAFYINSPVEIFAGGSNGIYRSTDAGISWSQFALPSISVKAIKKNPLNNYLFAGTTTGAYRSTDNGVTWNTVNGGLTNTNVNDLEILPDGVILAATGGGSGVYKSTNNGTLWLSASSGMTSNFVYDLFRDIYGRLYSVTSQTVFLSVNNAAGWSYYNSSAFPGEALSSILVDSAGNKFIGGNYGFYYGLPDDTWLLAVIGPLGIQSIVQDEWGYVYLGTLGRGVFKSIYSFIPVELISFTANLNMGIVELNWSTATEINNLGFEIQRKKSEISPSMTDKETEWEKIGFVSGYGTTSEVQFYSFTDPKVSAGKYTYRLRQIDYDGRFEFSPVVEVEVLSPDEFVLHQNYPNPFNPSTVIRWQLPVSSYVTLEIFNVLGQEVASLVRENLEPGLYSMDFNASGFNSGIYFYRIEATGIDGNKFVEIKKMSVIK